MCSLFFFLLFSGDQSSDENRQLRKIEDSVFTIKKNLKDINTNQRFIYTINLTREFTVHIYTTFR